MGTGGPLVVRVPLFTRRTDSTTKLLLVLTFRPEFTPPWKLRSHLSHLVLDRLGKRQVEAMIEKIAKRAAFHLRSSPRFAKTDGVPLFVEELDQERGGELGGTGNRGRATEWTEGSAAVCIFGALSIPATLQEALIARLDRLADARQIAQLGGYVGFENFPMNSCARLPQTAKPTCMPPNQTGGSGDSLTNAELDCRRVTSSSTPYSRHGYQSLLKSTRQQYHNRLLNSRRSLSRDKREST